MVLCVLGLQANAGAFFLFMLGIFAQNMAAAGLVFFLGAAIGVFAVAQTVFSVLLVFAMVQFILYLILLMLFFQIFGGFFISLNSIPDWLAWLQWFSFFKYSFAVGT